MADHGGFSQPVDLPGRFPHGADGQNRCERRVPLSAERRRLALDGSTLYVVQNFLNRLAVIALAPDLKSGVPQEPHRATAAIFGSSLYAINLQVRRCAHPRNGVPRGESSALIVDLIRPADSCFPAQASPWLEALADIERVLSPSQYAYPSATLQARLRESLTRQVAAGVSLLVIGAMRTP
jgi:hypothetical protein